MNTPIADFVRAYAAEETERFHMPGHKGAELLGCERLDITEIPGADSLYEAGGIIAESEANASKLFGAHTFYSTEGSSLSIRAMLYLCLLDAKRQGRTGKILAARNVHKTFLSACALLDLDVEFLPWEDGSYLSAAVSAQTLREALGRQSESVAGVYLTSPDYLGQLQPIEELAAVCHEHGTLLLVDNAHGAYLKFLTPSLHPLDQGADLCCDSAHKTLPTLTGGSYLHISHHAPAYLAQNAKHALALFGSTSPSYLILQSLDLTNRELEHYGEKIEVLCKTVDALKQRLRAHGYTLCSQEPLKLSICTKPYGYCGTALNELLARKKFICEFADDDYVVMMFTPYNRCEEIARLGDVICALRRREGIETQIPALPRLERVLSVREAMFAAQEEVSVENCSGRILAQPSVGCPPAVPIAMCGERLDEAAAACFCYYGIERISVVEG